MTNPDNYYWFYSYRSSNRYRKARKAEKRFYRKLMRSTRFSDRNLRKSICRNLVHQMLFVDEEQLEILETKLFEEESSKESFYYLD